MPTTSSTATRSAGTTSTTSTTSTSTTNGKHATSSNAGSNTNTNNNRAITPKQSQLAWALAIAQFLSLGGYWLMRPLKMGIFVQVVGLEHEPRAKLGTVLLLVPLLVLYNRLAARTDDIRLVVKIVIGTYATMFALIGALLFVPSVGFLHDPNAKAGTHVVKESTLGWCVGWITYWTIETFGSIVMPMFWSVVASVTTDHAPFVFSRVNTVMQLGAVLGATLATYAKELGIPQLCFFQVVVLGAVLLASRQAFLLSDEIQDEAELAKRKKEDASAPTNATNAPHAHHVPKETSTDLTTGLRLVFTHPYVASLLVISTAAEVVSTVMDYQLKVLAQNEYQTPEEMTLLMGRFGQAVNGVSLLFALFGSRAVMERFGIRFCLIAFPVCTLLLVGSVFIRPTLGVVFFGMVAIKALGYSLNAPSKEMLYRTTSKDIKMQAKSWIDMFGSRNAKALGSLVTELLKHNATELFRVGSLFSGGLSLIWLLAAEYLGVTYNRHIQNKTIVT
ncbi:hypothetical protein CAOG_01575 [Capsaspora owczarzaki ATCC 30864]|uniref:ADP,ATP carrier protein n=1 Tax=Capsaspora owczarzaki (strain ATCC 30864) TaxID=595528 RepID=A0A0D2X158_CAPO3|nr:hypothetical protein CAOG_01575 [Capsaspora owczarzaki ATCC 30864]KJE90234.1 hypothetical protein CAOG_001575 [Capsaspora owczarzaki ATCC 30864]|eukprot:XP_004364443.2 hypothetical protein CAOG_01575 [Capsaspora owczarzaki ATCC 30864]